SMLDVRAFKLWAALSGVVPRISVVKGRCFAGNAVIAGCSDLIVATKDTSIGMGGPAMIAGGGLGDVHPDEVGPLTVQSPNGVVDVVVDDEQQAVAVAKRLIGYFQGTVETGDSADQTTLRTMIPERARRAYPVGPIIETLADAGSVTFLREKFAPEMAARFLQLCDAFGLPVLSLVDCPGYMVGPAAEADALVRRASRMLVAGAALRVPLVAVILRRGYGLGAQAMTGGSLHEPLLTVAWPNAHLGPMGLEGAVRLGLRKELEAIPDEAAREEAVRHATAAAQENAKALNAAQIFEIDDVIDPAETRALVASTFAAAMREPLPPRRPVVDTW
ncbi:biotin carboxylase, partial [Aduncisulcus paluster]